MKDLHITYETRDTAVQVRGVTWCNKIKYRTRTCDTRFGNSAGLPAPVLHPILNGFISLASHAHHHQIHWYLILGTGSLQYPPMTHCLMTNQTRTQAILVLYWSFQLPMDQDHLQIQVGLAVGSELSVGRLS